MINASELISARVPRYTSYPTAPHFHPGIDAGIYSGWLQALHPATPLSLYVHVPFCDTLCWFCGCHTTVVNTYSPLRSYLDLLEQEIGLIAGLLQPGHSVTHIHWGGGSPTMLQPGDIGRLANALRERFSIVADAEFAIEIDPRGFNPELAAALRTAGVTRASIGVQDCDAAVQRAINRIQPMEETARAVDLLRDAEIRNLNVDLIYGLPHQTVAGIERTVDEVLALDPDRLAIFGYAHVPHFKKHQNLIPVAALPGAEERFAQAEAARARLCGHGYVPIGIDHFAKPQDAMAKAQRQGRLTRNFQGYTTDDAPALIGLGASSIGAFPKGYVQNIPDVPTYRSVLSAGRLPVARGIALSDDDRARRQVIERLMCDLRVDLDKVAASFGRTRDMFADSLRALDSLVAEGMVSVDGGQVSVMESWRAGTRLVCAAFDTYLDNGVGRHAVAV
ncbi:MAG: oxygen-independent coproporphyrinogen III oxidase [Rhizomicrobium sp.]